MSALRLLSLPRRGEKHTLPFFPAGADSRCLTQLAALAKQPLLVLTEQARDSTRLAEEISFFAPQLRVAVFPDWETLPYDHFSPHADLVSERLATLWRLRQGQVDVLLLPVATAMQRLAPLDYLAGRSFMLSEKQRLDTERLRADLVLAGYQHVTQVYAPGEFSIRGGLIDLFPMGASLPYRIDLMDDEIDGLRTFDVDSQRTLDQVSQIQLLPAREFPSDEAAITAFRSRWREQFEGDPSRCRLYKDVSNGILPAGIEYWLPLFFEQTATIFDYLGPQAACVLHHHTLPAAEQAWQDIVSRYNMIGSDPARPGLPPDALYLRPDALMAALKAYPCWRLPQEGEWQPTLAPLPPLHIQRRSDTPFALLEQFTQQFTGRVCLVAESVGRRETLNQFLRDYGWQAAWVDDVAAAMTHAAGLILVAGQLTSGFIDHENHIAFVTEFELYQHQRSSLSRRRRKSHNPDTVLRDLAEIRAGDPVVHEEHGIGLYQGLVSMDLGDGPSELMVLEYADGAKLYVPVSHLNCISRYAGMASDKIALTRLGSTQWEKARKRAAEKVRDTAAELLNLYAQRAARRGHAFALDSHDYDAFAESFGFEETADQAAAIQAVLSDMTSGKPMDRLVCGDVGFGKTEVALRAAFVAVMGGKQVAVLVPTTLLAEQHYQNFSDRFADWPVKIAELSRFRSAKELKTALAGIKEGTVDIVIGTHRLLQPDVDFARLGLVIIDEEHRFGVRHKEQLKRLRTDVDVLTLTATPIPRTLAMSLEGLRDFSVIATAPNRRLAVKTFVSPTAPGVIREAVLRELKRGGQVFFLYNEVDSIDNMRQRLVELLPEARIEIAHGQMRERELEQVMRDFTQQRFNVLLCSTIIETGIDIPNANTILIHRADKFGLAQLHQLRGRVGRSHHQAYAYLLTPDHLTRDAQKRLEAIQAMEDLGAGFALAMHDLEIRGAGEVLGEGQSGEMQEVGFSLYTDMLKQAVRALQQGKEPDLDQPLGIHTEIHLAAPALLPEDYCPDVHERLVLYKRMACADAEQEIDQLQEELIDRFGLLPSPVKTLLDSHRLRLLAHAIGIKKCVATAEGMTLIFDKTTTVEPIKIIQLIQSKRHYKLLGQDKLKVEVALPDVAMRVVRLKELLRELVA